MKNKEIKPYPEKDPVTEYLRAQGFEITAHYMGNTSLLIGGRVENHGCEIIYRVDGNVLIPIVYRRVGSNPKGLKNMSKSVLWFMELLAHDIPEIEYIRCNLDTVPISDGSGLSIKKLYRFCYHILGIRPDPEFGWFCINLSDYKQSEYRQRKIDLRRSKDTQ